MADEFLRDLGPDSGPDQARNVQHEWPAWLLLTGLWLFSLWAMGRLPARVPIHWDLHGQVNGWASATVAALLLPVVATGIYLLILAFDWRRFDFKAARAMSPATTRQVRVLALLLMVGLQAAILWPPLRGGVVWSGWFLLLISLFFVFLGNLMPRLEPNAWVGIRIPPTLENREVWRRTHRMGGRLFMAAGLVGLPLSLVPEPIANLLVLPVILPPVLASVIYAYWLRHRLDQDTPHLPEPR